MWVFSFNEKWRRKMRNPLLNAENFIHSWIVSDCHGTSRTLNALKMRHHKPIFTIAPASQHRSLARSIPSSVFHENNPTHKRIPSSLFDALQAKSEFIHSFNGFNSFIHVFKYVYFFAIHCRSDDGFIWVHISGFLSLWVFHFIDKK